MQTSALPEPWSLENNSSHNLRLDIVFVVYSCCARVLEGLLHIVSGKLLYLYPTIVRECSSPHGERLYDMVPYDRTTDMPTA